MLQHVAVLQPHPKILMYGGMCVVADVCLLGSLKRAYGAVVDLHQDMGIEFTVWVV